MANSKYDGGARVTTFRLPLKRFEEAKKGIEDYLERFRTNNAPDSINLRPFLPEVELTDKELEILENKFPLVVKQFPCGCFYDSILFRRQESCKVGDMNQHYEFYL